MSAASQTAAADLGRGKTKQRRTVAQLHEPVEGQLYLPWSGLDRDYPATMPADRGQS